MDFSITVNLPPLFNAWLAVRFPSLVRFKLFNSWLDVVYQIGGLAFGEIARMRHTGEFQSPILAHGCRFFAPCGVGVVQRIVRIIPIPEPVFARHALRLLDQASV